MDNSTNGGFAVNARYNALFIHYVVSYLAGARTETRSCCFKDASLHNQRTLFLKRCGSQKCHAHGSCNASSPKHPETRKASNSHQLRWHVSTPRQGQGTFCFRCPASTMHLWKILNNWLATGICQTNETCKWSMLPTLPLNRGHSANTVPSIICPLCQKQILNNFNF